VIVDTTHGLSVLPHLAVVGSNLYGTNHGTIAAGLVWSSTASGAGFNYLTPLPSSTIMGSADVGGMGIDGTDVWFGIQSGANAGTWKTPLAGPQSMAMVSGFYGVRIFAVDTYANGPYVYIGDLFNPGLAREPKSGNLPAPSCVCFVFGSGYAPATDVLTDSSGNVFWSLSDTATGTKLLGQASAAQVASWPMGLNNTCPHTALAMGVSVAGIGLDATNVYFSDVGANKIKSIPIGGGPVTDLTSHCSLPTGNDAPTHLVVDSTRIYWANGSGKVWSINKDGTTTAPGTITPIVNGAYQIFAVAVDTNYVYFTDSTVGRVLRVSK
jgi:hypothetical protein